MTPNPPPLIPALLRPPILSILRASGFQATRPAVLESLVDICARYLHLLCTTTAEHVEAHNRTIPTLPDVRAAMQEVGVFRPQMGEVEEWWRDEEDMRGVDAFLAWCVGQEAAEIRRCAGMVGRRPDEEEVAGEEVLDYLTVLKRKHSKTGEESRYQGTVLGKEAEARVVKIEGGPAEFIQAWKGRRDVEEVKEEGEVLKEG